MKPVVGLRNVWSLTFSVTKVSTTVPSLLSIYQTPEASIGACNIEWLKIEKGSNATPNITQYKYFGESLKDSNNPKDYSWDVTPEFTCLLYTSPSPRDA